MDRIMLSDEQARLLRLRSQRLDRRGRPAPGAVGTVHQLCGVHAQLPSASALTLRPRTTGLAAADVERARVDERALRIIRLALDRDGALTRPELAERLAVADVDPSGQRIAHLVHRAGLEGLVCHGPDRGAEPTFVLLEDWLGAAPARTGPLDREVALGELARRYLAAYAPAGPRDLAWWSRLEPRRRRADRGRGRRRARVAAGVAGRLAGRSRTGRSAGPPAARLRRPHARLSQPRAGGPPGARPRRVDRRRLHQADAGRRRPGGGHLVLQQAHSAPGGDGRALRGAAAPGPRGTAGGGGRPRPLPRDRDGAGDRRDGLTPREPGCLGRHDSSRSPRDQGKQSRRSGIVPHPGAGGA